MIRYHGARHDRAGKATTGDKLKPWGLDEETIESRRHSKFRDVIMARLKELKEELKDAPVLAEVAEDLKAVAEAKGKEDKRMKSFSKLWKDFEQAVLSNDFGETALDSRFGRPKEGGLWEDLRRAWLETGKSGLDERIKYAFYGHVTNARFTKSDINNQVSLADLRYPTEWYPATRQMQRTIHLHVGPTNSGKTYHALQRLEQADTGVYAGPLRLLAHEVYTRLNAKGKPCALITGEERRAAESEDGRVGSVDMSACTVEMMPLNKTLDVAVIDEIQMIGNSDRGWAWTQALLGVKAREVHLCGEARTIPLIKELCASVGEKLEIHRYERLSPLQMANDSLRGSLKNVRKGDCIVSFSVMGIHALRREIEKATGRKVATVYGSLPPETRAQQARLFNDPHNDYDYLVASDAVGMGLNLAIKRIIFESSSKFDGTRQRTLSIADIKQIGGRAGRFRTAAQANDTPTAEQDLATAKGDQCAPNAVREADTPDNMGIVTTLEKFDFPVVRRAMESEPEPIQSAGLFPPASVLERFASYFPPGTPFSYILTRLHELCQMHKRFHLCGLKDQVWLADIIEPVENLTIADRNIICSSPASKTDREMWQRLMPAYARCIATQSGGNIADIEELPLEILEAELSATREYLRELERLHKGIVTYLWLSYRFAGIFNTRALAFHVKSLVEERIEFVLDKFSFSETQRRRLAQRRENVLLQELVSKTEEQQSCGGDAEQNDDPRTTAAVDVESRSPPDDGNEITGEGSYAHLRHQTSLTAGGDRFGGEEALGLEEEDNEVEEHRMQHGIEDEQERGNRPTSSTTTYRCPS